MYKSHIQRIFQNPIKLSILIILVFIPSFEVLQLIYQLRNFELERTVYKLFFLSGAGRGHLFQVIYLWLLPLYLLFIVSDDSCYDEKIGYKYVLMSRVGRKKYIQEKWITSFVFSTLIMFISLFLNIIFVYLAFGSRCSDAYIARDLVGMSGTLEQLSLSYPLFTYFIYTIIASIISGFVGMLGAIISTTFRDKKYTYAITFMIWLIFIVMDDSIMLVLQPYIEYPMNMLIRIFIKFIFTCLCFGVGACVYEKKRACE